MRPQNREINFIFVLFCLIVINQADECMKLHEPKLSRSCCDVPYTDEIIKKCSEELKIPKQHEQNNTKKFHKSKISMHMCVAECEFQRKGYLRGSDDIDLKAVHIDMTNRYPHDLEYVVLFKEGLKKCLEFARKKTKEMDWLKTSENCNLFSGILIGCTYQQIILDCPHSKWDSKFECEELKTFVQKCNPLKVM